MTRPFRDQTKAISNEVSWDAAHCMRVPSPTVTSALEGAKVILVWSADTHSNQGGGRRWKTRKEANKYPASISKWKRKWLLRNVHLWPEEGRVEP